MELRPCKITFIDLHHTAGNEPNTAYIRKEHMSPPDNWGDIGYNAVIEHDGTVGKIINSDGELSTGRDIKWSGAHNPALAPDNSGYTMNQRAYAISHIGNFEINTMPEVQFQSSVKFCTQKCKELGIVPSSYTIRPHNIDYATECPGKNFPLSRYISEVIKLYNQGENELKLLNLVSFFGDGDRDIATNFAIHLGCPLILASQVTSELSNAVTGQKYQIGGASAPAGFKLLSGLDRFATDIAVLKEMGRI